jgi:hypothetical protein
MSKSSPFAFQQSDFKMIRNMMYYPVAGVASLLSSNFGAPQALRPVQSKDTWADVIMFSGCEDQQTSADTHIRGKL